VQRKDVHADYIYVLRAQVA